MGEKDPNDFAPYAGYLHTRIWPSVHPRTGEMTHTEISFDTMPPQYAASALAKLVRWARIAPEGDMVYHPDEDSREYEARSSTLGKALAARAVNLEEDIFYAVYGEFAVGAEAEDREVWAELAVALGDEGLDWSLHKRIVLASHLHDTLSKRWKITEKFS